MKKAVIATLAFLVLIASPFIVNAAQGKLGSAESMADLEKTINQNPDELARRSDPARGPAATQCVEETTYMRVNHMQILKEERVNYVRHAERTPKHSIRGCFTCHDYDHFCKECHNQNGVQPTCLNQTGGCHSTDEPDYPRPQV